MDSRLGKRDPRVRIGNGYMPENEIRSKPVSRELMKLFDPRWSRKVIGMFWRPARRDRASEHVNSYVTTLLDCGHLVDMSMGRAIEMMTKGVGEFCHLCHDDLEAQARPSCQEGCSKCDDSQDLEKWLDEKIPWRRNPGRRKGSK